MKQCFHLISFIVGSLMILSACHKGVLKLDYPNARLSDHVNEYHGTKVADPFNWMEDDKSSEVASWVEAENKVTFGYLENIPFREALRKRLESVWNFERIGIPFKEGDYLYYFKNNGLQNQSVLYRKGKDGKEEVFLDPNTFSQDGTSSLGTIGFSKDGSMAAYEISEGGSDWRTVVTIDTTTKQRLGETLANVKFSGLSWRQNEGFYYSSYDKPKGSELSAKTDQHKLYFHKVGTPQDQDVLIFGDKQKRRYVSGAVTEDGRFLVIEAANSTTGNELYILDLSQPKSKLVTIVDNFDSEQTVLDNEQNRLLIQTNLNAPNRRVIEVDFKDPSPKKWKDLIPETNNVLSARTGRKNIFAHYLKDAISTVSQFDYRGKFVREIALPGLGSAGGFSGKIDQDTLYYSFSDYKIPNTIYSLDPISGASAVFAAPKVDFKSDEFESKQVFYQSKDQTKIPMMITYKKGIKLNGKNPTILYGYGGFNISLTPSFSITNAVWMEQGGIYAVPNLRGGGEYGDKWHNAGIKMNKQNVFDDFIAAAEYLIENKYTSKDFLAISGRSNGGLLVGATMTQRPDLMKVALPGVGVMDMLRYHTFTAGAGWAYDYGTAADDQNMFEYLKGYSPVHNVKKGVNYPATMVTTADHDDRVVPAHSFKFAAELQRNQVGENPVLIRVDVKSGHGAGKSVSAQIKENADLMAFTLYNMGFKQLGHNQD